MMMKKMMTFLIYKIGVALRFEKLICFVINLAKRHFCYTMQTGYDLNY